MSSHDKLKTFYLHYHNTYGYRTWQGRYTHEGASFHKVTSLVARGLVSDFDFSYTICRFKILRPKSLPVYCLVCVYQMDFCVSVVKFSAVKQSTTFLDFSGPWNCECAAVFRILRNIWCSLFVCTCKAKCCWIAICRTCLEYRGIWSEKIVYIQTVDQLMQFSYLLLKRKFFWSILSLNKSQRILISQRDSPDTTWLI